MTVVVATAVPKIFVAVSVYVVEVERAPVAVDVPITAPSVGLIESEVALAAFQLSTTAPFNATTVGDAEKEEMEGVIPLAVVPLAMLDEAETLPTLSCAVT